MPNLSKEITIIPVLFPFIVLQITYIRFKLIIHLFLFTIITYNFLLQHDTRYLTNMYNLNKEHVNAVEVKFDILYFKNKNTVKHGFNLSSQFKINFHTIYNPIKLDVFHCIPVIR